MADVVVAGPTAGEAHERFTREGPLALLPTPAAAAGDGRTLGLVWCMPTDAAERRLALDDGAFIAELQQAFGARQWPGAARGPAPRVSTGRADPAERCVRIARSGSATRRRRCIRWPARDSISACATRPASRTRSRMPSHPGVIRPSNCRTTKSEGGLDRGAIVALTRRLPGLFATRAAPVAIGRSVALAALSAIPELRREFARLLMFGVRT